MQRAQVQSLVGELKGDILRRVAKIAWGIITHHVLFCELAWITSLNAQQWPYPLLLLLLSHFSHVRLCATPQTAAYQALPSLGFSRQEHWSGLPFPSPMQESEKWKWSRSVVSDSSQPHGLQPTRLLCPWDFPDYHFSYFRPSTRVHSDYTIRYGVRHSI